MIIVPNVLITQELTGTHAHTHAHAYTVYVIFSLFFSYVNGIGTYILFLVYLMIVFVCLRVSCNKG